jgi:RNA polymerase sigma-70 factor (ECF subfamily)
MGDTITPGSGTLLILRLRECPADQPTWDQFVRRYGRVIYAWCQQRGLQDADCQDLTQDIFVSLLDGARTFDRARGRFLPWLYGVVHNRIHDWCNKADHRQTRLGTEAIRKQLAEEKARGELEARLNEEFDLELMEMAEVRVRLRVNPQTWDAYQVVKKQGRPLKEAAQQLSLPLGHVSRYANRVVQLMREEIRNLQRDLDRGGLGPPDGASL